MIEKLDKLDLPPSALDALIDYFGAEHVAEMTGRSKRMLKVAPNRPPTRPRPRSPFQHRLASAGVGRVGVRALLTS